MLIATLPPVSNRADWIEAIEFVDDDTNETIDLTGCTIVITVKDEDGCQALHASSADGSVVFISQGVVQFTFPRASVAGLRADAYQIGATVERDGETQQILIGTVPVVDGVVNR